LKERRENDLKEGLINEVLINKLWSNERNILPYTFKFIGHDVSDVVFLHDQK
jgi:hypothetical protein